METMMMDDQATSKRQPFKHHPHLWICLLLTFGEFSLLYVMFFVAIPLANKEIAFTMTGVYSAEWARSVAYWYNTTFGSNNKNDIIAKSNPVQP